MTKPEMLRKNPDRQEAYASRRSEEGEGQPELQWPCGTRRVPWRDRADDVGREPHEGHAEPHPRRHGAHRASEALGQRHAGRGR